MTSRWAYEALAVEQFANNPFEKQFFHLDAVMSRATYKKDWWIAAMRERLAKCEHLINQNAPPDSFTTPLRVLNTGFSEEAKLFPPYKFMFMDDLKKNQFNLRSGIIMRNTLDSLKEFYIDLFNNANEKKEILISQLTDTPQKEESFNTAKNKYENESLEEMVRSSNQTDRLVVTNEKIIQRFEPIYHINASERFFQAPLFSSVKNFFRNPVNTMTANVLVIWLMSVFLYLTLQLNLFRKVIELFSR